MLELHPMTDTEYRDYLAFAVADYAAEGARNGGWSSSEALARAEEQFQSLLPQGLGTPDHYFYSLVAGGSPVGVLWINTRGEGGQRHTFIYDIRVDDAYQGRGYGTQAIERLREVAAKQGAHSIRLHVFGHNQGAIRLYEKLGFVPTNLHMRLDLP